MGLQCCLQSYHIPLTLRPFLFESPKWLFQEFFLSKPLCLPSLPPSLGSFIFHLYQGGNRSLWDGSSLFSMPIYKLTCIFTPLAFYKRCSPPPAEANLLAQTLDPSPPDFSLISLSVILSRSFLCIQLLPSQIKKSHIPLQLLPAKLLGKVIPTHCFSFFPSQSLSKIGFSEVASDLHVNLRDPFRFF